MKLSSLVLPTCLLGLGLATVRAQSQEEPQAPVPVTQAPAPNPNGAAAATPQTEYNYEQHLYGPADALVPADRANQVVQAFRAAYEKLGKPRIVFYVNRDLVDDRSGLKLTARQERTETTVSDAPPANAANVPEGAPARPPATSHTRTVTADNTYAANDRPAETLVDKLTVREIEMLFGRPFRAAGATLADQKVASTVLPDAPPDHFSTADNEAARRDREALSKVADVVVEILVSSRTAKQSMVSGEQTVTVPDIQATAVRLSDAAVLGQASATDVLGKDRTAAKIGSQFDARDITEATALALMEDIAQAAK